MDEETKSFIQNNIDNNNVVLFMKGTPDAPQCGFSMAVANILKAARVKNGFGRPNIVVAVTASLHLIWPNTKYDEKYFASVVNDVAQSCITNLVMFIPSWAIAYISCTENANIDDVSIGAIISFLSL